MKLQIIENNTLTNSQRECIPRLQEFLNSDKTTFTIKGFAGTGKSYLTKYIIDNLLRGKRITVSAPTHKAVRVIENFTGKKGHTLHSLHGLRPNYSLDDFNIDNVKFESIGNAKFNEYEVIFIDEASMINHDLKVLNDTRARQFGTKIIYLGDSYQLPPVKEDRPSDVFSKVDYIHSLTEVVRQQDSSPLLDLFEIVRDDIDHNTANFINFITKNPTNINNGGYKLLKERAFSDLVTEMFTSDEFKQNIDYVRYAAYTNDSISYWNSYIRNILFPNEPLLTKGDILTSYKTIVDENNSPIITNSTDYKVLSAERRLSDKGYYCYFVSLLDLTTLKDVIVSIVDHTDKTFLTFYHILNTLHRNAYYSSGAQRGKNYKTYFQFKDRNLCMVKFDLADKNKVRGFVDKDITYGYGVTIHKLQGSTIANTLINGLNIVYYNDNRKTPRTNTANNTSAVSLRNRLLYTGLSRVSNIAYILL